MEKTINSKITRETKKILDAKEADVKLRGPNRESARKKSKFKRILSKISFRYHRVEEVFLSIVLKVIKIIVNINIDFLFIFAATYLFNASYPWYFRLLGSFGIYHVWNIFIKSVESISKAFKR